MLQPARPTVGPHQLTPGAAHGGLVRGESSWVLVLLVVVWVLVLLMAAWVMISHGGLGLGAAHGGLGRD